MKKKLILVMVPVFILALGVFESTWTNSFTVRKWSSDPEHRTRIVDDFLNDYELDGMSKKEVIDLLGKSDNDAGYFNAENRLVYYLGPERGLISIDSEWLIIDFANDIVSGYFITTD